MDTPITSFMGEHRFLSNFSPAVIYHDGILYTTVEHAFQAAKTLNFDTRWNIARLPNPGDAKRAGRQLTLRPDWEMCKRNVMQELVLLKFVTNPGLKERLLDTGKRKLIEGNTWGDTYWGVCKGVGENHLGKILTIARQLLR